MKLTADAYVLRNSRKINVYQLDITYCDAITNAARRVKTNAVQITLVVRNGREKYKIS